MRATPRHDDARARTRVSPPPLAHSVIAHHGQSPHSGHYTAYVKELRADASGAAAAATSASGWLLCDDASVRAVPESTALKAQAYILFYSRVGACVRPGGSDGDSE